VLTLELAKKEAASGVDWVKFFDRNSSYKLLYTLQIVQAVLEDSETSQSRAVVVNSEVFPTSKVRRSPAEPADAAWKTQGHADDQVEEPELPHQMSKRSSQIGESEQEDAQLRKQWAEQFLSQGGFEHILKDFMACSVASDSE
jgi:hypothetical protein